MTAESLTRRRANALELIGAVPKPNLPDIATGEIHMESAFGAKPIMHAALKRVVQDEHVARLDLAGEGLSDCRHRHRHRAEMAG
jgi:hypothetical protein